MTLKAPLSVRIHGGADALGTPLHDFSTNSNACGPSPHAQAAVAGANPAHYPDASYSGLRAQLARLHRVDAGRIVFAASASEFIFRITALASMEGKAVSLPAHGYGDYAQAVRAFGRRAGAARADGTHLHWCCDPSSPQGQADGRLQALLHAKQPGDVVVLDRAYEPLRLEGALGLPDALLQNAWQLWTPNKALGLTGVRAAYAVAPAGDEDRARDLDQISPSWPIGAHGVAMLQSWTTPEVQDWLGGCIATLRSWKARQVALCESMGWQCEPSLANFFCARPALPDRLTLPDALERLRTDGIKLRDTTSFGLPGGVRVSVQPPQAQDALHNAWQSIIARPA